MGIVVLLCLGEPADFIIKLTLSIQVNVTSVITRDLLCNWIDFFLGRGCAVSMETQGCTSLRMAIPTRQLPFLFSSDINLVILLLVVSIIA